MHVGEPMVFINPQLEFPDDEMMEVLDDYMCFPHLLVKVMRSWDMHTLHLDGMLATMCACDSKSFESISCQARI